MRWTAQLCHASAVAASKEHWFMKDICFITTVCFFSGIAAWAGLVAFCFIVKALHWLLL
jgi:hypothetical protein